MTAELPEDSSSESGSTGGGCGSDRSDDLLEAGGSDLSEDRRDPATRARKATSSPKDDSRRCRDSSGDDVGKERRDGRASIANAGTGDGDGDDPGDPPQNFSRLANRSCESLRRCCFSSFSLSSTNER